LVSEALEGFRNLIIEPTLAYSQYAQQVLQDEKENTAPIGVY